MSGPYGRERGGRGGRGGGGWGRGRGRGRGWGRGGGGSGGGAPYEAGEPSAKRKQAHGSFGGGGDGDGGGDDESRGACFSGSEAVRASAGVSGPFGPFSSPRPIGALASALRSIDGDQYPAYKRLAGAWALGDGATLRVDRVQGDAYAPPSRVRVLADASLAALPAHALDSRARRVACADWLARRWALETKLAGRDGGKDGGGGRGRGGGRGGGFGGGWGAPKGGDLRADVPGQTVLERTSVQVYEDGSMEARCTLALPARGRTCLGVEASRALLERLPAALRRTLDAARADAASLRRHCDVTEDAQALRGQLSARGLVAFVADGALLPRRSGSDDRPRDGGGVERAPEGLREEQHTASRERAAFRDERAIDALASRDERAMGRSAWRDGSPSVPLRSKDRATGSPEPASCAPPPRSTTPFVAPADSPLAVTLSTPHLGPIRGLGVPRGVTLIAGGGFHGKSTLLAALVAGVDDHIPGDGRERVVALPSGVAVRAEDGRSVAAVDVSAWIGRLPGEGREGGERKGRDPRSKSAESEDGGNLAGEDRWDDDDGRKALRSHDCSPLSKKLRKTSLSNEAAESAPLADPKAPASCQTRPSAATFDAAASRPLRSTCFTTANASGSTSQAAGMAEAIEVGCQALFLDEDTSASNLLARDARMKALVPPTAEPIRVLLDSCRAMAPSTSLVLVAGSSGDFLAVADAVIVMHEFLPSDETERAWAIARQDDRHDDGRPGPAERDALDRASRLRQEGRGSGGEKRGNGAGAAVLRLPLSTADARGLTSREAPEALSADLDDASTTPSERNAASDGPRGAATPTRPASSSPSSSSSSPRSTYHRPTRRSLASLLGVSPPPSLFTASRKAPPASHPGARWPRIRTRGASTVLLELPDRLCEDEQNEEELDLSAVELLRDGSRTRAVAGAIAALRARIAAGQLVGSALDVAAIADWIDRGIDERGLAFLEEPNDPAPSDWARPRRFEIVAALNRIRTATFAQERPE